MATGLHEPKIGERRAEREFFESVQIFHRSTSIGYVTVHHAYSNVKEVSKGRTRQERGYDGKRKSYISHARTVAFALMFRGYFDYVTIVVALLHDLLEDFPDAWPLERIQREYGFEIAHEIESLTRLRLSKAVPTIEIRDAIYAQQLQKASIRVKRIKIVDRLHNMKTYHLYKKEKRDRKIKETIETLMPIAIEIGFDDDVRFFLRQWLDITL